MVMGDKPGFRPVGFLLQAPHPNRILTKGMVRGVPAEETADDPLTREIRSLGKPVDRLARGKSLVKLSRKH